MEELGVCRMEEVGRVDNRASLGATSGLASAMQLAY